ncbi:DeoR/GlpR family DNA-binding transcription regulator [Lentibacillus salinarum]|uniref:Lactose phosphotransferase system repressor n=1 Tax=Lentibacillus salinarum TaxID=446820 RepID=A0ABW3ZVV9_9BACI
MIREQRLNKIKQFLEKNNFIQISDIKEMFNVTEMTIRRDLQFLENEGVLEKIHGGAKRKKEITDRELSHIEKSSLFIEEKKYIAKIASSLINTNDTVYIGAGTTNEFIYDYLDINFAKVITNSLQVFEKFKNDDKFEVILVGGKYRERTGAFVGSFTIDTIKKIRVKKAFIGVNGVYGDAVYNYNDEEGDIQSMMLDNSYEKYILCDHSKIDKEDFYSFYRLSRFNALITDTKLDKSLIDKYSDYTKIINYNEGFKEDK